MIEKAKSNPVEVKGRGAKLAALLIIAGVWILWPLKGSILTTLPRCDDSDTVSLVGEIVNAMPLVQAAGAQFISVKEISEQGFNQDLQIRSCSSTLVTTAGEDSLQYSIKWANEQKKEFVVEAQIQ